MIQVPSKYFPLYNSDKPIILITGGRGSGKSFHVSTFAKRLSYEEGHKILYTRYTIASADISIIPEVTEKMELEQDESFFSINKKDIKNNVSGSDILFRGIKTSSGNQTAKLKSIQGLTTFILDEGEEWENEEDYDKLKLSIRKKGIKNRVIIVMNPCDSDHFIYQKYLKDSHKLVEFDGVPVQISTHPQVEHIHTTYLDAKEHLSKEFLLDVSEIREKHLSLPQELKYTSKYALKIVGAWADRKEGAIFNNWTEGEFDKSLPYCFGQDYGYTVDPTTMLKIAVDKARKKVYLKECFYLPKQKLGTSDIYELNKRHIETPHDVIVGDSAEKRLIDELIDLGLNMEYSEKGAGSIREGITSLQDYELIVDPSSHNLKSELKNYIWNNRKSGIPIDNHNHLIDPLRYGFKFLTGGNEMVIL